MSKLTLSFGKMLWLFLYIFLLPTIAAAQAEVKADPNKMKLREALLIIEKQYKITILFEDKIVDKCFIESSVINQNESVETKLANVLRPFNLTFKNTKAGAYIIVTSKKTSAQIFNSANSLSQQEQLPSDVTFYTTQDDGTIKGNSLTGKTINFTKIQDRIKGLVLSETGAPIPGVTVSLKGTNVVSVTSSKGEFSLLVREGVVKGILSFSSVGYQATDVAFYNLTSLKVFMKASVSKLEDVVVVGYGRQRKVTSLGAVVAIGTKELVQSPVANISNSLVGRLSGIFAIQGSGEPGNDQSQILIRGIGTFSSGNRSPLILVDGIQVDSYNNIDPNEIESISILKDASSTAVYGIRGANGVILITTKRGKAGVPVVNYSGNTAFNSFTDIRQPMNSYDFANSLNQAVKNDTYVNGNIYSPVYSEADLAKYQSGEDPIFYPNVNWYDLMLKKVSLQQRHTLSINGGSDKVKYFVSSGYFNQEGLFKNTNLASGFDAQIRYKRFNFRSNLNFDITKRFKANLDVSAQIENRSGNNANTSTIIDFLEAANPLVGPGIVDDKIVTLSNTGSTGGTSSNPLSLLYSSGYKTDFRNQLNGSIRLEHELDFITKGLSTHAVISYQNYNRQLNIYSKNLVSYQAKKQPDGSVAYLQQVDEQPFGFTSTDPDRARRTTIDFAFDYKRNFGGHNLTGLLLYSQIKTFNPSYAFGVPSGYQKYAGRVEYNYKGRYLLEYSAAYEGTENFAPGNRFGYFPALSLGWAPTAEKFFPKTNAVSFLKLRASYGEVGNDQLSGDFLTNPNSRFLYRPTAYSASGPFGNTTSVPGYYYFGVVGNNLTQYNVLREGRTNNPFLSWERAIKMNFGIDASFWNGKLAVTLELWKENRNNILATPQTISRIVGTAPPAENLGKMNNKGYEGELTFRDHVKKINYWVKANYSFARNKIIFQDEVPRVFKYQMRTGQRLEQLFGMVADGFYNTWDEVNEQNRPLSTFTNGNKIQPGDIKYRDINGDGILDVQDEVPIGYSATPEITYGVSFGGDWKGFDLSILFQGTGHVSMTYSRRANQAFFNADPAGASNYLLESWTPERYAAGLPINFPRFAVGNGSNNFTHNYRSSTFWIKNSSYLRLKNAEIGYTFMPRFLRRYGVKSARIFANGNNLITWSNLLKGIDPETANLGTNFEPYPLVRTINAGININF